MCVCGWVCTVPSVLKSHAIFDPLLDIKPVYSLGLASSPCSPLPSLMCVEKDQVARGQTERERTEEGGRERERGREAME